MIRFTDFFSAPDPKRTKIKFNMNPNDDRHAWDLLLDDSPEWLNMNMWRTKQTNNNLNHADYLIALAQYYPYGPEYFIFGGLYKVTTITPDIIDGPGYSLELMDEYKDYIKRLIIKLERPIGRNIYNRRFETIQEQLNPEIYELAPRTKLGPFPGYQNVSLTHAELRHIINRDEPSWKQALSHVKAVYVITDRSTGQLYVGSASGNYDGLWQRWTAYAHLNNLTGGNKEIEQLKQSLGAQHIQENFQYSILEIFDTKTKVNTIVDRENYWKRALDTRIPHGLNWN